MGNITIINNMNKVAQVRYNYYREGGGNLTIQINGSANVVVDKGGDLTANGLFSEGGTNWNTTYPVLDNNNHTISLQTPPPPVVIWGKKKAKTPKNREQMYKKSYHPETPAPTASPVNNGSFK
jgi:hypothetical protein